MSIRVGAWLRLSGSLVVHILLIKQLSIVYDFLGTKSGKEVGRIGLNMRPVPKPRAFRSKKYLAFVREHECCYCHAYPPSEAHHFGDKNSGIAMKPPDSTAIPLCAKKCHIPGIHQKPWEYDKLHAFKTMVRLLTEWMEKNA